MLNLQARQRIARLPAVGPDLAVANEWIRSQIYNRLYMVQNLYTIALLNAEVRTAVTNIRNEVFRRGLRWVPKFEAKCPRCKRTFGEPTKICPKCQTPTVPPDLEQKEEFIRFMKQVNEFGQNFEEVLRVMEDDVQIADDAFGFALREYILDDSTNTLRSHAIAFYRLHPSLVNYDLTSEGEPLKAHWACPVHREMLVEPGFCKETDCRCPLKPVLFTYLFTGTRTVPLFEDEIVHFSKFSPSTTFGFSPLLTVFEKVLTLIGMDKYVYRYFYERKMPAAMLVTATDDPESIRREREYIMTRLQQDPDYLPWAAVSARTGRGRTELVRLFHTLQEMDYLPVRNEIRERVAAIYGVTPVWMGAPSTAGGLSGQSQELIVTSRVVEGDQRTFNEKVTPRILKMFGVTDWNLILVQPEEKAESTRLQFAQQRATTAKTLHDLGFTVEIQGAKQDLDDLHFVISGKAAPMQQPGAPGVPGAPPVPGAGSSLGPEPSAPGGGAAPYAPLGAKAVENHSDPNRPLHPEGMPHRGTMDERNRQEESTFAPLRPKKEKIESSENEDRVADILDIDEEDEDE